jgi:hypothetical protein
MHPGFNQRWAQLNPIKRLYLEEVWLVERGEGQPYPPSIQSCFINRKAIFPDGFADSGACILPKKRVFHPNETGWLRRVTEVTQWHNNRRSANTQAVTV